MGRGTLNAKGALRFEGGSTQHVILPDGRGIDLLDFSSGPDTAKPFTIAVWVNAALPQADGAAPVSRGFGASEPYTIDIFHGQFRAFVRQHGGYGTLGTEVGADIGPNGRWQYVVAVYDPLNGLLSLYIDGVLAAEKPAPHQLIRGETAVSFGCAWG